MAETKAEQPYNPLDKKNLGVSVADAMLEQPVCALPPPEPFQGAGIYAIDYVGDFPVYKLLASRNREERFKAPIYIGKVVPKGARKGGFGLDAPPGRVLHDRLAKHAESIRQASSTLRLEDFACRYLVVDDIWIPLGESLLIERFTPVWNLALEGFGNNDPGKGRYKGRCPAWDVVHPGRPWAKKCEPHGKSTEELKSFVRNFLASKFAVAEDNKK